MNRIFITACLIISTQTLLSQTGNIRGTITDMATHTPVQQVTVQASSGINSVSDALGSFAFTKIKAGSYELVISHVGYKTEVIPVTVKENSTATVPVQMKRADVSLSGVVLSAKKANPLQSVAALDIRLRPVRTSQDVLRMVPGLFIAQHAGGGKAEQIFLRGYDIDHGTDIHITVDGMPVNMVSHAHGQGYSDLHFLIPETIEKVAFQYGPYAPQKGNMATAGYAEFQTKDVIKDNSIKVEAGQFNTKRTVGMLKVLDKENEKSRRHGYAVAEYYTGDGYFESPQNFHRLNLLTKFNTWWNNRNQLTISASTFGSKWNASGQVPLRAVAGGIISRFGSLDNTEGGNTQRTNITAKWLKHGKKDWKANNQLYYTNYHFNLFSNFTFFLKDSINGDQINQKETRNIFGYNGSIAKDHTPGKRTLHTEFGYGFRYDAVKGNELARTAQRRFLESMQKGNVRERNTYLYVQQSIELSARLNASLGVRFDHFNFGYQNLLHKENNYRYRSQNTVNPKLAINYDHNKKVAFFARLGTGFHSNDTRVILEKNADKVLPKVFGADAGLTVKPSMNALFRLTLWQLQSQQEFVYVGDEGIVEAGGRSARKGIDLSVRYQVNNWLFADVDVNAARARSLDAPKGENFIPLAPSLTSTGGVTVKNKNGFSGSLRYRYVKDRPANETNTVVARGYFITDLHLEYQRNRWELFVSVENLLNRQWNEAQFDTESRLKNEAVPVSEIHFTPGTPRFIKAGINISL